MNAQDFNASVQELLAAFPVNATAFQDAFRTQAALGEKVAAVALEAAAKSAELSEKWNKDTLSLLGEVSKVKDDPAAYSKALTDFAAAQVELNTAAATAGAEVAKTAQAETVDLLLTAGKSFSEAAAPTVRKAPAPKAAPVRRRTKTAA